MMLLVLYSHQVKLTPRPDDSVRVLSSLGRLFAGAGFVRSITLERPRDAHVVGCGDIGGRGTVRVTSSQIPPNLPSIQWSESRECRDTPWVPLHPYGRPFTTRTNYDVPYTSRMSWLCFLEVKKKEGRSVHISLLDYKFSLTLPWDRPLAASTS